MYYQFDDCNNYGRYLTLTQEDYRVITEWINEYFVGGSAPTALENYKKAKESWQDEQSRHQRLYDFLMQRRDLVDALAKSVIDSSAKEIQVKAEQEIDKAVKEKIDKTVRLYFK